MKTELQKLKDREYSKKYYRKHKKEILARRKARYKAKMLKDMWVSLPKPQLPKIQDVYIQGFYSTQLAKIEKALWYIVAGLILIAFAIKF